VALVFRTILLGQLPPSLYKYYCHPSCNQGFKLRRSASVVNSVPALTHTLSNWEHADHTHAVAFRRLAFALLQHSDPIPAVPASDCVEHLVTAQDLHSLLRDLTTRGHKIRERAAFLANAPPELASVLPWTHFLSLYAVAEAISVHKTPICSLTTHRAWVVPQF
jgi:hypothetical protein